MNRSRITGDLTASGLLYADIANDRVGIGSTIPGNKLSLPDSAKIGLGNAEDLTLYHDSGHSYIEDTGTGNLLIKSDSVISIRGTTVAIKSADNSQTLIKGVENAGSELYFNNNLKLTTSNTGIDVTGAITADDLRTDNSQTFYLTSASDFRFRNTGGTEKLRITSDGNTGIGTNNPATILHLQSVNPTIRLTDSNQAADNKNWNINGGQTQILRFQAINDAGSGGGSLFDFYRVGNNIYEFRGVNSGNTWFTINNNTKKVGIGEDTPTRNLHIDGTAHQSGIIIHTAGNHSTAIDMDSNRSSAAGGLAELNFKWNGTAVGQIGAYAGADTTNKDDGHIHFGTASAGSIVERLRITSGGQTLFTGVSGTTPLDIKTSNSTNNTVQPLIEAYADNATYKAQIGLVREGSSGLLGWAFLTNPVGSPTERLRIASDGVLTTKQSNTNATSTNWNGAAINIQNTHDTDNNASVLAFFNSAGGGDCAIQGIHEDAAGSGGSRRGHLQFGTSGANSSGSCVERLRINSDGQAIFKGTTTAAQGSVAIESGDPAIRLYDTNGTANNRKWDIRNVGGQSYLQFRTINDANDTFSTKVVMTTSGHMGLGVTPSAWPTNADSIALQIGTGFVAYGRGSGDEDRGGIAVNYYNDGSNEYYIGNGNANRIYMNDGNIDFHYAGTNSSGAGAALTFTTALRITSTGQTLIGAGAVATPKASVGGLDVSSGLYSIVMGGEANTGNGTPRANSAQKEARLCMPHYTNAQEPAALVYGVTLSGENRLILGGGSSLLNAATSIKFYTAADTTTTSGSERLRITSTGKLGLGIAAPDSLLHIHDGSAGSIAASSAAKLTIESSASDYNVLQFLSPNTASQQIRFGDPQDNGAGYINYNHDGNVLSFGTNGPEKLRINSGGQISIRGTATAFDTTGDLDSLQLYYETDSGQASIGPYSSGGSTHLSFYTNAGAAAATEKLRIDSNGNFGFGDTVPANFTGYTNLSIHGSTGGAITFGDDGTDEWEIYGGDGQIGIYDRTNTTYRVIIDDTGKFKIGSGFNSNSNDYKMSIKESSSENAAIMFLDTDNMRGGICGIAKGTNQILTGTANVDFVVGSTYSNTIIVSGNGSSASPIERLRITTGGDVSMSSDGSVFGVAKLSIVTPGGRTAAFSASDGDTWHDVVIKNTAGATNNAVGLAFQITSTVYHKNAGVGIAAVKNGTNSDYGADMVFVTRPQSAVAAERLRITDGGLLLLGTTDTGFSSGYTNMTIGNTSTANTGLTIVSSASNGYSRLHFADANSGTARYAGWIAYSHSGDEMLFSTSNSGSAKVVIDSSGRLGIGGLTPSNYYSTYNQFVMGKTNDSSGMTIVSGSSHAGYITFADGTSSTDAYRGRIFYLHSDNSFNFRCNGLNNDVLKIDSSSVHITGTTDGVLNLDTSSGNGSFIRFKKSGTTKHWIGSATGLGGHGGNDDLAFLATSKMLWRTGSTLWMTLDSTGRLGLGVSSNIRAYIDVRQTTEPTPLFNLGHNDGSFYRQLGTVGPSGDDGRTAGSYRYLHVRLRTVWNDASMTMFRITGYSAYSDYTESYFGCYRYNNSGYRTNPYGQIVHNQKRATLHSAYNTGADPGYLVLVLDSGTNYSGFIIEHIGAGASYGSYMQHDLEIIDTKRDTTTNDQWPS